MIKTIQVLAVSHVHRPSEQMVIPEMGVGRAAEKRSAVCTLSKGGHSYAYRNCGFNRIIFCSKYWC
jgi:hypothetical protein